MKILGMDSSGLVASVAVVENDILVAEYTVNHKKTHSQTLLPMLDEVVRMTELDLDSIDAIAVAAGPGSFTGLRIGAATVKALGLALDKPVVSVPTCHGLAYNMWGTDKIVCPIMDARRNQVYTGVYEFVEGKLMVIRNQDAMSIDELIGYLNTLDREVIFVGDGIPVYGAFIKENLKVKFEFAPAGFNRQRASSVATLGLALFEAGDYQDADEHKPIYLRKSQAEREREEQMKKEG
ncbi:MAG: tRNA (adenosine(37)-N6)-threonylcarbamoyltransferase complex dimerization subunit type 1 TsaB [Lachnospiraceae bacterium]|nr:tRNA (adenosine(37)-N6)-threonylcarbamoyltransferase complex dimerization subunit type 1 TsaB [Lachnospiraceae bacterium]MBQ8166657.1 tRNA (adenosine(37)-N6)-threonylcarbamoyltransferase complex dimerization subunit type 1 TsaB [Lachnospiraceae bacterium]